MRISISKTHRLIGGRDSYTIQQLISNRWRGRFFYSQLQRAATGIRVRIALEESLDFDPLVLCDIQQKANAALLAAFRDFIESPELIGSLTVNVTECCRISCRAGSFAIQWQAGKKWPGQFYYRTLADMLPALQDLLVRTADRVASPNSFRAEYAVAHQRIVRVFAEQWQEVENGTTSSVKRAA